MTEPVSPPAPVTVPLYPALGSANFNSEAYAYGSAMPAVAANINATGEAAYTNAVAAKEKALAAAASEAAATTNADLAMGYRNTAQLAAAAAADAQTAAQAALDSFDDRYLGQKPANPATDNDGGALVIGALYFRTTAPIGMKVWTGTAWDDAYANLSSKFDKTGGAISGGISVAGNILSTGGALGYGVGAGGSVVQATSKSTSVTLNKPNGVITLHPASLAAGGIATFALNNTSISDVDTLSISFIGSVASVQSSYSVQASTGAGVAFFTIRNETTVLLSEAVQFTFKVIKGSIT